MEINRLLVDELNYKLMITGYELRRNVQEKQALLRLDPLSKLSVCSTKLDELAGYVEEFDSGNADNEYTRIKARLLYVNDRLEKVAADPEDAFKIARLTRPLTSHQYSILDVPNLVLPQLFSLENQSNPGPSMLYRTIDDLINFVTCR
ncbi:hypothetical protein ILUMI_06596 [Ignelater luminosus]|uniref:Uncharacterized protein n=1 Tax=Ignelater luminosus TaxID=2038154 RepID=A0A8K0D8Y2_IGNLU|nr:hypothetical protein ILUMI_06596 [Ignelater luminosus]